MISPFSESPSQAVGASSRIGLSADDIKQAFRDNLVCGMGRLEAVATKHDLLFCARADLTEAAREAMSRARLTIWTRFLRKKKNPVSAMAAWADSRRVTWTRSHRSKRPRSGMAFATSSAFSIKSLPNPAAIPAQSLACNGHESKRFGISPRLIIVLPMMVAMMATVVAVAIVITWIPGGAIINAPPVIIPIARITVAAIVIARLVISRCYTHAEAEVWSFRIRRNQKQIALRLPESKGDTFSLVHLLSWFGWPHERVLFVRTGKVLGC